MDLLSSEDLRPSDKEVNRHGTSVPNENSRDTTAPYTPAPGMEVMELPAQFKLKWLKNKKVVHRWSDGWYAGTWRSKCSKGDHKGQHAIYHTHDKQEWYMDMEVADYGVARAWVIITKA